ncbi:protein kinase [Trypanosoma theileri]|uniref:Protein kinase n=1 Tax=Trypanosoma theileri TaxID=67003 RepID=A0A1X0NVU6_9TRYP|nr:protein kinase [Trypanosoma theileri]ORC88815.1 protein kinase [Trypanosoma theileri]
MGCGSSVATTTPPVSNERTRTRNKKNSNSSSIGFRTTVSSTTAMSPNPMASNEHRISNRSSGSNSNNGKTKGKLTNAQTEKYPVPARRTSGNSPHQVISDMDDDDDFDVRSANGDMLENRALSSGALSNGNVDMPNLATFYNEPQECFFCCSAAVTHMCEQCENLYICDECMFNDACVHDPTHAITGIHETQSNASRTFGSSLVTVDGGASSLFYDPCLVCGRVILDVELVYHCDECNVVVCGHCYQKSGAMVHEHELKSFQRAIRSNAASYALLSKSRNSEGNKVINDYVVVKQLGRGSYAKVNLVQHRRERALYALKILKRNRMNKSKRFLSPKSGSEDDDLLREIAVMKFVSHPNIVKLKEVIDDVEAQKVYVIMEYCEKGPIHVLGHPPLPLEKVRKYARDIISGLLYMHREYLFHRDIKPANCLVDGNDVVKIADFGTCSSQMKNANIDGTPAYSCPEQCLGLRVTGDVVDSWAFAVSLYQISHGYLPVRSGSYGELRNSLLGSAPIEISPKIDPQLRDVLSRMLEKDFSKRMLLRGAARHPFFGMSPQEVPALHEERCENGYGAPNKELYLRALKGVLRGKGLSSYFHGTRAIRKINRNEVNYNLSPSDDLIEEPSENKNNCNDGKNGNDSNDKNRGNNNNNKNNNNDNNDINNMQEMVECMSPPSEIDNLQVISMMLETQKQGKLEITDIVLHELPTFLSDAAPHTTEFRLSNNGISSVANLDFSLFSLLREVSITNNALTVFPIEVLAAQRLQKLDLSHNRIVDIPPAVNRARMLERLSLHSNCIKSVGTDKAKNSVFSGRCLRHVRLSCNPLLHLPEALSTCPNLELVLDDAPTLVEEWEHIVSKVPNVVVVWNDIYPRLVHSILPVYVASKNIHLYKLKILHTLNIQHVVLLQIEKWLPLGKTEGKEMERCVQRNTQETTTTTAAEAVPERARRVVSCVDVMDIVSSSPTHNLPPILQKAAFETIKSYFVISEVPEDPLAGFIPLRNYVAERRRLNERVLFFLEEKRMSRSSRETAIGVICSTLQDHMGPETPVCKCYQMVMDAIRGLYG